MLRKLRIVVSLVFFVLLTFCFLDFAGISGTESFLPRIQIVPAVLSLSVGILIVWIILTLLLGRVYCSSVCPMGVFQDVIAWLSRRQNKRRKYGYRPARTILRWSVVGIVILAFLVGFTFLLSLTDPYSAYGRMITNVFKPLYVAGNNGLAWVFTKFGNYTFYYINVTILSLFAFIVGLVTFGVVGILSWRYGRMYCNTFCPVGTLLGFLSRYSLFKVHIDTSKCNGCGLCALKCKGSCIDSKEHSVDYSRCVACFDCLENCRQQAVSFTVGKKKAGRPQSVTDESKRRFLATTVATALVIPQVKAREHLENLQPAQAYKREYPLSPPGAVSAEHLLKHCTACHLCVTKCPSHVLKPAFKEYGWGGMMQPMMYFEDGFCNFDCTVCSEVCPNGAILPLTVEQKHATQVGRVIFLIQNCIVNTDKTSCGACSEHCPTQAVTMVPFEDGLTIPHVNPDICVGCGGCEYVCPVRPFRAIHVEGNPVHLEAKPFKESEQKEVELDDFGF